jgi:hypothetical protein
MMTPAEIDKKALDIYKRILKNRNAQSNQGIDWNPVCHVTIDEHMWLRNMGYSLAYDEYITEGLTQPNNTICKDGVVIWTLKVNREERKRGGCYRRLMPTITKV